MQKDIHYEWLYNQAPSEVWEYLTRADLIALWLMPNNFKLQIGCEFQFRTNPMPNLGLDGIMHCQVLEIVPMKKLTYTWKAGSGDGVFTLDTLVEWHLEAHGTGSKLTLKHSGFTENNAEIHIGMTTGWQKILEKMHGLLNNNNHGSSQS